MLRGMRILLLALGLMACGPKRTNQCAGHAASGCVGGSEVCSFDRDQGCQVCQCNAGNHVTPGDPLPSTGPDDRSTDFV